ncbi:MAG: hypothetical protein H6R02_2515 [Burkholderiaceae bacterium]|jgi:hypothetical protein|nr:hypothetical protein [Burkholderiaceae bacterium]
MKKPKQHPTSRKPEIDKASTDTPRQGLDRDTAQRQQRDNMLTDTNATQSSEATGGPSEASAGRDPRTHSTPDQRTHEAGRRSSVESPVEPDATDVDRHGGSERDTLSGGGRGQG